jgi:glycosyltransferase involved in cell wall biosynthesis
MSNIMFSLVIPAYNYGMYIRDTIESIQAQSFTDWECIIINDGSDDNTDDIVRQCIVNDSRFRYISQDNAGLVAVRNKGIMLARGEYIVIVDADDILREHHLHILFDCIRESQADVAYVNTQWWWEFPTYCEFSPSPFRMPESSGHIDCGTMYRRLLFDSTQMTMHSAAFRKDSAIACGLFVENKGAGYEDNEFWIRMARYGCTFYYQQREYALYRQHDTSIVHSKKMFLEGRLTEIDILRKQFDPRFISQEELSERIAEIYRSVLRDLLRAKEYSHAKIVCSKYFTETAKYSLGGIIRVLLFRMRIVFHL